MNKAKESVYDVIIVGAGITGLTLALRCAQLGMQIKLIDKKSLPRPMKAQEMSAWVSALNNQSIKHLMRLGIWQLHEDKLWAAPYHAMTINSEQGKSHLHFHAQDIQAENLGHIVCNLHLRSLLAEAVTQCENIEVVEQELRSITPEKGYLTTKTGQVSQGRWIVGADGADSWVRKQVGITVKTQKLYSQEALVGLVSTKKPHFGEALQCFSRYGVVALLPHFDLDKRILVWSKNQSHHELSPYEMIDRVFMDVNVIEETNTSWKTHRIRSQQVDKYHQGRVVLVGDSALTVHPLAGQGLNLGLQGVSSLGDILETAFYNHQDCYQEKYARAYERKIRGFNSLTKTFIESCDYVWHSDKRINQNIGYYGLKLLQNIPWLKKQCIQHALYGLAEE